MIDVTIPSQVNENADIKGKRKEYIILRYSVFTIWQADTQQQQMESRWEAGGHMRSATRMYFIYLFIYLLGGLESVGLARPPYMWATERPALRRSQLLRTTSTPEMTPPS